MKQMASEVGHNPRYRYDCGRCKFSWCCGYQCACSLYDLPAPPKDVEDKVIAAQRKISKFHERLPRKEFLPL